MKIRLACAIGLVATLVFPLIRAQDRPKLSLTGDRFRGLTYEELTPAQKVIADRALAGRGAIGIFNITLRSPELSDAMRGISASRTQPLLTTRQNELAILLVGRYWTTQYEWMVHHRAAVRAGLSEETIAAIADGKRPAGLQPDEAVIYDFLSELLNLRQVLDPTFQKAKEKIGEKGIVDLIGLTGFYQTVSLMMNVDRFPLPAGQKPELARLANPLPLAPGDMIVPGNAPENPATAGPLRGDRFKPLAVDDMTPPQKALFDLIQSGKLEGGVNGPLNILLRSPDIGAGILSYGVYERFHTPLSAKLLELTALTASRAWTSQFPWYVHHRAATQAGLSEVRIQAIAEGRKPVGLQPDEQAVYNFCAELLRTTQVSDVTFDALKQQVGERNVVEIMGVMGYYQTVAMLLNVDRYPLPDGAAPELKTLDRTIP